MVTIDYALETAMSLPASELDDFIEILQKRRSQQWRKETTEYYSSLKNDIQQGKFKPLTAQEAIAELHEYEKKIT